MWLFLCFQCQFNVSEACSDHPPSQGPFYFLLTHVGLRVWPPVLLMTVSQAVSLIKEPCTEHSTCHVVGVKNSTTLESKMLM